MNRRKRILPRNYLKVLSLFDGISCGRVALERSGFNVDYYASEIDKHAIEISDKHGYSVRLGDVRSVGYIPKVDLLIGGSPCQDLSIAKKDRKGLDGDRSGLFWEYVRVLRLCKPKWFILENVASMPKADRDIITREMGVEPIMIDASLVSAQSRKRLFWTNIPVVGLPPDRGIRVKDILEPDVECPKTSAFTPSKKQFTDTTKKLGYVGEHDHQANRVYDEDGKSPAINTLQSNGLIYVGAVEGNIRKGMEGQEHLSRAHFEGDRVYSDEGKAKTLTANGGGKGGHSGLIQIGHVGNTNHQGNRVYSEEGKAPTLTKGSGVGGPVPIKIGLNQVGHVGNTNSQGNRVYDPDGKSVCLSANGGGGGAKTGLYETTEHKIRKLAPIECERLQGLPDNYTEGVATTHRYRCLGNAFNVDVIAFILSFIPHT
jgi:DNA (cytosine-5)-methyltransferase 3A